MLNIQGMDPSPNSKSFWKITDLIEEYLMNPTIPIPVIALSETWLKPHITDAQISIPRYQTVRADRNTRERGGALLYIHEDLPITDEMVFDNGVCEIAICTTKPSNIIIASLYRPPDTTNEEFSDMIQFLQKYINNATEAKHMDIMILGDFNLPCISWADLSIKRNFNRDTTECAKTLLSFMEHNFMSQYVDVPTRQCNILDLLISNSASTILHIASENTKMSDHNIVKITTQYPLNAISQNQAPKIESHSFRSLNIHKADLDKIRDHLQTVDWDELIDMCTATEFQELLKLTVLQVCELYTPEKKVMNKQINKHTRNRKTLKRNKRNIQNTLNMTKSLFPEKTNKIKSLNKKLNDIHIKIRESIEEQQREAELRAVLTVTENPRYFFSYAKKFAKRKSTIGPLLDQNKNLQQEPKKMADLLQDQYSSVFSDPYSHNKKSPNFENIQHDILENINFTQKDITDAISEIGTYAACSENDIPAIILKHCKEELSYPLWKMWRESLDTGFIPSEFKNQFITPVHKKGSKAMPSNYRPISLTSHLIKIFERVVRKKLVAYLEENNILCPNQHGFRKGRSCLTQLLNHVDKILQHFLRKNDTDSIYLDYAKAFDKVDHYLLLEKLSAYGIRGKLHAWFTSYLKDRIQTVVVNGEKSYPTTVKSGVPQGTVRGPVLFILYLNDLKSCIKHSYISSFADDTRLIKEIKNALDVDLLQSDLNASVQWTKDNNMELHTDKFEYLCHTTGTSQLIQELPFSSQYFKYTTDDGAYITPTPIVRDLGINVVAGLRWSPHINIICDSARKLTSWVLSVFRDRSAKIMLPLYKCLIRSTVEYCCPLWDPTKVEDIMLLESIQRYYTSKIVSVSTLHYWDRLKQLNLISLQRRRERYSIITMYKILHNITPNDLGIIFQTSERRGIHIRIPNIHKDASMKYISQYDSSFPVRGAMLWNTLPPHITAKPTMESFKYSLTTYLRSFPDNPPIQGLSNRNSLLDYNLVNRHEGGCCGRSLQ